MVLIFGEKLQELRTKRGLSQGKLAKRLGMSTGIIGMYENNSRLPSLETLIRISKVFGVTTDYLLGIEDRPSDYLKLDGLTEEQLQAVITIVDEYKKANGCYMQ